jgi:hypothetical protein
MKQIQYFGCVLLCIALLLYMGGCGHADKTASSDPVTMQTEQSVSTTSADTVPEESAPTTDEPENAETTAPTEAKSSQGKPAQSKPAQTKPTPTQTEPAVQIETIQAQPVIDKAAAEMQAKMPEAKYEPGWSKGTEVRLPVAPKQSEQAMADKLVSYLLELFTQPDVDYTYGFGYRGYDAEQGNHIFTVTYSIIEITVEKVSFDSAAVVSQATQFVLDSDEVQMSRFDGSNSEECLTIRDVPAFYSTQEAAECLGNAVVEQIKTKNRLGAGYSEFYIVYDSNAGANHVFLLYLK